MVLQKYSQLKSGYWHQKYSQQYMASQLGTYLAVDYFLFAY